MAPDSRVLRLIHVSDIHVWRYAFNPLQLFSKRILGMGELLVRRARRFRLERLQEVVERVQGLRPDHILITGDLTTTALPVEFRAARTSLDPWLGDPGTVTILPGNHDRYTVGAHRGRLFERSFGEFAPSGTYPWLRWLDAETAILGLDPTRSSLTARGKLPEAQFRAARELIVDQMGSIRRLIVACHYPLNAPAPLQKELQSKRLVGAIKVGEWLATIGPHLYCCGHVHSAWTFSPPEIPEQLCLNAGAPLLRDPSGRRLPGFLEILLEGHHVDVFHHAWDGTGWIVIPMCRKKMFLGRG